jgi:REP element-mobilizing transposase RayT
MGLYHVNFHTLNNAPIFENETYDHMMRGCLRDALREHKILCPAWEVMPTHVHMIVEDFPDLPRATIMRYVKGSTSHAFFSTVPELRGDLLGGHLWTKGYYFASIVTHQRFLATLHYVRTNRQHADLPPPAPLESVLQG